MNPYICEKAVKAVIISFKSSPLFLELLNKLNISVIFSKNVTTLPYEVSDHPDLQVYPINKRLFAVCIEAVDYYTAKLSSYGMKVVAIERNLSKQYPGDCLLNIAPIEHYFIANKNAISNKVKEILQKEYTPIYVKQGYCKCNIIILPEVLITSDEGIYKALKNQHINVELIPGGNIILEGYNTGFIGGTCGMISRSELLFYGDLEQYEYKNELEKILNHYEIISHYPSSKAFVDHGSIIPIQ